MSSPQRSDTVAASASGERVLVVADPYEDVMAIHPLDTMITAYHASLTTGSDPR